jgi:hypothetical protein
MPELCRIKRFTRHKLDVAITATITLFTPAQPILFGAFAATRDALFFESY